jgi:hypothetical protein
LTGTIGAAEIGKRGLSFDVPQSLAEFNQKDTGSADIKSKAWYGTVLFLFFGNGAADFCEAQSTTKADEPIGQPKTINLKEKTINEYQNPFRKRERL